MILGKIDQRKGKTKWRTLFFYSFYRGPGSLQLLLLPARGSVRPSTGLSGRGQNATSPNGAGVGSGAPPPGRSAFPDANPSSEFFVSASGTGVNVRAKKILSGADDGVVGKKSLKNRFKDPVIYWPPFLIWILTEVRPFFALSIFLRPRGIADARGGKEAAK